MTSRELSKEELLGRLDDQVGLLRDSCERFDRGNEKEYVLLAVNLRVLLHDKKPNSRSLLGQLGIKQSMKYVNTARNLDVRNLLSQQTLVLMRGGGSPNDPFFKAPLGEERSDRERISPRLGFGQWWRMGVLLSPNHRPDRQSFTREDLVLTVTNKEGGAHIDPNVPEEWYQLTRENSMGWERIFGEILVPGGSPVPASIRQIAFEVDETLRTDNGLSAAM